MTDASVPAECGSAVAKYKNSVGAIVETSWSELDLRSVVDGVPWRRFPWYLGQGNYSGLYWSSTERRLIGYESRLELARLTLADFDCRVERIASQPFHLVVRQSGSTLRRTPDYLLQTSSGPVIVDVKPALQLRKSEVADALARTREVVESRGCGYEVACEPDPVTFANVRFLAGYRRDWLFDKHVCADVTAAAAAGPRPLSRVLASVDRPKHVVLPALFHLLWTHSLHADLGSVLSRDTIVAAKP